MPMLRCFDEDAYRTTRDTTVAALHPGGIELDATVSYIRSGGQTGGTDTLVLADGTIIATADTAYSSDRRTILYVPADNTGLTLLAPGMAVTTTIDWDRRHRLMWLYICLHPLDSLIPVSVTGCGTSSDAGRIDPDLPESTFDRDTLTTQFNELVGRNTPVHIDLVIPEELPTQPEFVRITGTVSPADTSAVRIIHTDDIDR